MDQPSPQLPRDRDLQLLAILIDGVIAQKCRRHYRADTQEHQLSSRIAEAIESEIGRIRIGETWVEIVVQELPDRGRGSKEKKVGADLYVSIVIDDGREVISKGLLVQSKWDDTLKDSGLTEQAEEMRRRTKDGYVWAYGPEGVAVYPANEDALMAARRGATGGTVGELLSEGAACRAGDTGIGRDTTKPIVDSLNEILNELSADTALSLLLRTSPPV